MGTLRNPVLETWLHTARPGASLAGRSHNTFWKTFANIHNNVTQGNFFIFSLFNEVNVISKSYVL
jgi:hypothetical protein